jgi:predicted ribosomally synthesized peptide with nif11-like leader
MSIENARAFYQRMTEDNNFRSPFETASTKEEKQQLIKNAGYEFTVDEWQAAMKELEVANDTEELSEADLEAIAGGKNNGIIGLPGTGAVALYGVILPGEVEKWI